MKKILAIIILFSLSHHILAMDEQEENPEKLMSNTLNDEEFNELLGFGDSHTCFDLAREKSKYSVLLHAIRAHAEYKDFNPVVNIEDISNNDLPIIMKHLVYHQTTKQFVVLNEDQRNTLLCCYKLRLQESAYQAANKAAMEILKLIENKHK